MYNQTMIAYLQGTVRKKNEKGIIVDTGSIGYLVYLPQTIHDKMKEKQDIELFIETRVREDDISLYGFETFDQLELFKAVTNITGVGAKIGLEVLSRDPEKVKAAIMSKDIAFLSKIPGVGKKTAERLIMELKSKTDWNIGELKHQGLDHEDDDAMNALISLGYQKHEVRKVLRAMPDDVTDVEEVVTYFLQNI